MHPAEISLLDKQIALKELDAVKHDSRLVDALHWQIMRQHDFTNRDQLKEFLQNTDGSSSKP